MKGDDPILRDMNNIGGHKIYSNNNSNNNDT